MTTMTTTPKTKSILLQAEEAIHGERVKTYGPATTTFNHVANAFNSITGLGISSKDICLVLIIMKLVRNQHSPENPDHRLDACGYLGIMDDLVTASLPTSRPTPYKESNQI